VCFVPGRGPAALVVIHKHSPPKLEGGREGGREKKEKEAQSLSPGLKTGMTNTIS